MTSEFERLLDAFEGAVDAFWQPEHNGSDAAVAAARAAVLSAYDAVERRAEEARGAAELLVASAEALQAMEAKIREVTGEPSAGHDLADEVLGLLRVARQQRDDNERLWQEARRSALASSPAPQTREVERIAVPLRTGKIRMFSARDVAGLLDQYLALFLPRAAPQTRDPLAVVKAAREALVALRAVEEDDADETEPRHLLRVSTASMASQARYAIELALLAFNAPAPSPSGAAGSSPSSAGGESSGDVYMDNGEGWRRKP